MGYYKKKYDPWYKVNQWKFKQQNYRQYLQSARWQEKKDKLFKMVGHSCEFCGERFNLQVHHLTYSNLEYEKMTDLVVVCKAHHDLMDAHRKRFSSNQSDFAHWMYNKFNGDSWRGSVNLKTVIKLALFESNIKIEEIDIIFGIPVELFK